MSQATLGYIDPGKLGYKYPAADGEKERMTNDVIQILQPVSCMAGTVTNILSISTHLLVTVNPPPLISPDIAGA